MKTNELNVRLWNNEITKHYYGGCYAANKLPRPWHVPQSFVVNEDLSGEPGTHWVAIFFRTPYHVDYFDSYARTPTAEIWQYLATFPHISRNINTFQSKNSSVCGFYTMVFLYMCSLGFTLAQIEQFLRAQPNPDRFVVDFVNKNF